MGARGGGSGSQGASGATGLGLCQPTLGEPRPPPPPPHHPQHWQALLELRGAADEEGEELEEGQQVYRIQARAYRMHASGTGARRLACALSHALCSSLPAPHMRGLAAALPALSQLPPCNTAVAPSFSPAEPGQLCAQQGAQAARGRLAHLDPGRRPDVRGQDVSDGAAAGRALGAWARCARILACPCLRGSALRAAAGAAQPANGWLSAPVPPAPLSCPLLRPPAWRAGAHRARPDEPGGQVGVGPLR